MSTPNPGQDRTLLNRIRHGFTRWAADGVGSNSQPAEGELEDSDIFQPTEAPSLVVDADVNAEYQFEEEDEEDREEELVSLSASSSTRSASRTRWTMEQAREVHRQTGVGEWNEEAMGDFNYNDEKHNERIFFTEAMRHARKIQKQFPKKILCGGLALRLYGVIERDWFGDIDFVSFEPNVVDGEVISLKCSKPFDHCLFLSSDLDPSSYGVTEGLKLQDLEQILYWKQKYNRKKDKEDLKKYLDSQFLKEDDLKL